jgi:hypothetical protein
VRFFYRGRHCLAKEFPEKFKDKLPHEALILPATAVCFVFTFCSNFSMILDQLLSVTHEWETGTEITDSHDFTRESYATTSTHIARYINKTKPNPYHWAKTERFCESIAEQGGLVLHSFILIGSH